MSGQMALLSPNSEGIHQSVRGEGVESTGNLPHDEWVGGGGGKKGGTGGDDLRGKERNRR